MEGFNGSGPNNGLPAYSSSDRLQHPPSRPFTLQEALPFSPQTSSIPFIPDIIPSPLLGSGSASISVADELPSTEYQQLNQESGEQLSRNAKLSVDYVLKELRGSQRTQLKFRTVPQHQQPLQLRTTKGLLDNLSPVAKSVYDRVGNFYKPTPVIPPSSPFLNGNGSHARVKSAPLSSDIPPQTPQNRTSSVASQPPPSSSSKIEVAIPSRKFDSSAFIEVDRDPLADDELASAPPEQLERGPNQHSQAIFALPPDASSLQIPPNTLDRTPTPSRSGISIVSKPVNKNEYQYLHVVDSTEPLNNLSSRRQGQPDSVGAQSLLGDSLDQRQRGDAAVDAMDRMIKSVYGAVSSAIGGDSGYEHIVVLDSQQQPMLTGGFHQKLHAAVQKVIGLRSFDKVPLEYLLEVQKLSQTSVRSADELNIRIGEDWDEEAIDAWLNQFPEIETALKASRTSLRLLTGGREDKQLYSENSIQQSITLFKNIMEDLIVPIVEMRGSGTFGNVFKVLTKQKKPVVAVFVAFQKLLTILSEIVAMVELSEMAMNTLEFTASRLIFVENAYYEKDSVVGTQKFDGIRSAAMDLLCQIFMRKPLQRQGIIDDILISLEKLPSGKQASRQFKLSEGGSIQPVSALIMRLVQASSGHVDSSKDVSRTALLQNIGGQDGQEEAENHASRRVKATLRNEDQAAYQYEVAMQEVTSLATSLSDTADHYARYVIGFIVKRATGATKTGDAPYRNLLDLFVDDFTTCLDSPDWPAAELLLRQLMVTMITYTETPRTAAPVKNMALEILGSMTASITALRSQVKKMTLNLDGNDPTDLSRWLADIAGQMLNGAEQTEKVLSWAGPFRATLEHLQQRSADDPYLASAISFLTTSWATWVCRNFGTSQAADDESSHEAGRMAYRLRNMIEDTKWLSKQYTFKAIDGNHARLAYAIILLNSQFCKIFDRALRILLTSMNSEQATVRSRSLKSINQVLQTDPSILDVDSTVTDAILGCLEDSSPQVRDSALSLLGNCMELRPRLKDDMVPYVIARFSDTGVGVRKRAVKLARDIYLQNRDRTVRSDIASNLLRRVHDRDEGVKDLARQMIEEIWFAPFYRQEDTAAFEAALLEHVALITQTVKTGPGIETLDKVFQTIIRPQEKSLEGPFAVCTKIVALMVSQIDGVDSSDPTAPSSRDTLNVLTVFAKADPKLFTFEQIRLLKPQLASWGSDDERIAFRATTIIYQRVLPELPVVHNEFLDQVRKGLMGVLGRLHDGDALDDLFACIAVTCELLKDFTPLGNAVGGSLAMVLRLRNQPLDNVKVQQQFSAYCNVVGFSAKHCDLDPVLGLVQAKVPQLKGDSVPRLIIDALVPFASPEKPLFVRSPAVNAIGRVCQSWPRNYVLAKVYTCFQQVFEAEHSGIEVHILNSFLAFLTTEELRSENSSASAKEAGKKQLAVMGGTNFDDVASATTQRFLKHITRITLSKDTADALLAVKVLSSINRQGLTHPKETGVTLITLETSPNSSIAEMALAGHRALHEKHETVLEREYIKAVQSAYNYQRDVVGDTHGAVSSSDGVQSKLYNLMDVMKISKMKNRQRFIEKLCAHIEFDPTQLDASSDMPTELDLARFVLENVAFFTYPTVGEIQSAVNALEKMVNQIGVGVAQSIESEILNMRMDLDGDTAATGAPPVSNDPMQVEGMISEQPPSISAPLSLNNIDTGRLRQLAAASMILIIMWETRTYLRRLYGLGQNRHDGKAKDKAKDLNRAPVKVQGIHSDKFWDDLGAHMTGLQSEESMLQKCKAFVEMLNVDKDFKVAEEEDDMEMEDVATPSGGEDDDGDERGRKRKGGTTPGGRKKRPRSSSQPRKRGRPRKLQSVEPEEDMDADRDWI